VQEAVQVQNSLAAFEVFPFWLQADVDTTLLTFSALLFKCEHVAWKKKSEGFSVKRIPEFKCPVSMRCATLSDYAKQSNWFNCNYTSRDAVKNTETLANIVLVKLDIFTERINPLYRATG